MSARLNSVNLIRGIFMKSKAFRWVLPTIAVLVLAAAASARGENPRYVIFSGTINDYTPQTNDSPSLPSVAVPWEVRGHWTLVVNVNSGNADFSAELTMERSDQGVNASGGGDFDVPANRNAHTHHIHLVDEWRSHVYHRRVSSGGSGDDYGEREIPAALWVNPSHPYHPDHRRNRRKRCSLLKHLGGLR